MLDCERGTYKTAYLLGTRPVARIKMPYNTSINAAQPKA